MDDGEAWGKQKHLTKPKRLKNSCKPELKQKKLQKIQPLTLYIPFFTKKVHVPLFIDIYIPSISDKWCLFHIPCLELCISFDCCKLMHSFFLHRNQSQKWLVHRRCFIFLFVGYPPPPPPPLHWRSVNPLQFIFYPLRSTDFEKEIEGL